MIEINKLKTAETHAIPKPIEILHPDTDEPCGFTIYVVGPDSQNYRREVAAIGAEMRAGVEITNEDYALKVSVACSVGWDGIGSNGEELKFSDDECRDLYSKSPKILYQVFNYIDTRVNFTQG